MNAEWLRTRGVIAAAVGAGLLLGAAGVLLYQQLMAEKKRLDRVASSVSLLRREVEHLKSDVRPPGSGKQSYRTLSDVDMYSTVSRLDEDDEDSEFFDLSDGESGQDDRDGFSNATGAGDTEEFAQLLNEVDSLLVSGTADEKSLAYHLLQEHKNKYHGHVSLLWRLARASHAMASVAPSEKKKDYMFEGLEYAKSALALDDHNADAHKWYAITLGSCGDFLPLKEKIGNGYVFKQHVDKAISLRPMDYSLYHLLGRFEFEVASLSWLERKLASSLIAAPPEGSYEHAMSHFDKAEELSNKEWKENRLFIAKCCAQLGQLSECVSWLDKAAAAPVITPEDTEAEAEVQLLLSKYQSYRS